MPSEDTRKSDVRSTAIAVAYVLTLALWTGGLAVLGAIVAPTVFGIVPAPTSADAMTVVFRRFDRIAMICAVVSLVAEALLAWLRSSRAWLDRVRTVAAFAAGVLATLLGAWLSPAIEALHRAGAVRGLGDAGVALERLHRQAEAAAKTELLLLVIVLALLVVRVAHRPRLRRD